MPGWLQPFVRYQPVSVASDAVRGLAAGTPDAGDVLLGLGWTALLVVLFGVISVRLYQKEPQ
jgi:ABC-2 type transport system permease protein